LRAVWQAQERELPGRPIFKRRFHAQHQFSEVPEPHKGSPNLTLGDLKSINRAWVNYDIDHKKRNTMLRKAKSWAKALDKVEYSPAQGFPKVPCFDPAPFNETGFPFNPRDFSQTSAQKRGYRNTRTFQQPFTKPSEMQHATGLGGHEEDPWAYKTMQGFGDATSSVPYIEFMPKPPPVPRGHEDEAPDFGSGLLPKPRFKQTESLLSPRKRLELFARYDEDGDGKMDSEELAAAPPPVREFMARNQIGPSNPATKYLPRGSLTFTRTGPLLTPRRTHQLACDRHDFSEEDLVTWKKSPRKKHLGEAMGTPVKTARASLQPIPMPPQVTMPTRHRGAVTHR